MSLQGVKKLPIVIHDKDIIKLYKKISRINKKLGTLNVALKKSIIDSQLISMLSYNESIQSTRIEGTQVTFHEIMESKNKKSKSWETIEVINYHKAIQYGTKKILEDNPISSRLIKELHSILMEDGRGTTANRGDFRKVPNFIGPTKRKEDAVYIPIDANEINDYMTNLEYFINDEEHHSLNLNVSDDEICLNYEVESLLKIAIAHAQFESIHPFLDGNGRLGRILIVLMAIKEKLLDYPIFFVSEELEQERVRYYNNLNSTRGKEPIWMDWLDFFLDASERMVDKITNKIENVEILAKEGLGKCNTSIQKNIWLSMFYEPVATAKQISELTGYHPATVKKALDFLTEEKLLYKDKNSKRNVKYFNYDLMRTIS